MNNVHGAENIVMCRKFAVIHNKWPESDDENEERNAVGIPEPATEIRPCCDPSCNRGGSHYNLAWSAREKILCSDADSVLSHMVASQLAFRQPPYGSKDDLIKSYHQVGRNRKKVRVVQLFWNPQSKDIWGREQLAQDFGHAGAVTACNVVFLSLIHI